MRRRKQIDQSRAAVYRVLLEQPRTTDQVAEALKCHPGTARTHVVRARVAGHVAQADLQPGPGRHARIWAMTAKGLEALSAMVVFDDLVLTEAHADILDTLIRSPMSAPDVADDTGREEDEVRDALSEMSGAGFVRSRPRGRLPADGGQSRRLPDLWRITDRGRAALSATAAPAVSRRSEGLAAASAAAS